MNIAIIDKQPVFTQALSFLLLEKRQASAVNLYRTLDEFLLDHEINPHLVPDLVIMDIPIRWLKAYEKLSAYLSLHNAATKVLILSSISDIQTVKMVFRSGVNGFTSKLGSLDELLLAIDTVIAGQTFITPSLSANLVQELVSEDKVSYNFSPREREVINSICKGSTIREIAHQLGLSSHTIQSYHRNIMKKLNLKRTVDLISFAIHSGLYDVEADSTNSILPDK